MYQNLLSDFPYRPKENTYLRLYISLFPNTVFAFYPDGIELYMTVPLSTGKTLYRVASYGLPDI